MSDQTAADGTPLPSANNFTQLVAMMEDGNLHHDATNDLKQLIADMTNHQLDHGGKVKGTIDLKIKLTLEDGVFEVNGEHKITAPKAPRSRTIMYPDGKGNLTPHNPKQRQLFGKVRDVTDPSASGNVRSA